MPNPAKEFKPDWEKILAILDTPRQEIKTPVQGGLMMDGAWDRDAATNANMVALGIGVKRLTADIGKSYGKVETPTAFLFVCQCGYIRRVTDSEINFTCERPKDEQGKGCEIYWSKEIATSTEKFDAETGDPVSEVVYEERETPKQERKYRLPKITGRLVGKVKSEEFARRRARGEQEVAQPILESSHEKAVREEYAARDERLKNARPENA